MAYQFLNDGETAGDRLTYGQLAAQAQAMATSLQALISPGDRVLLLLPSGLNFIAAFFGCLWVQVVAVPVYPPRRNQRLERLLAIIRDCQPALILTTAAHLERMRLQMQELGFRHLLCESIEGLLERSPPKQLELKGISAGTLAFLQYTSGSTGNPKGVMVTHRNLMHNQIVIQQATGNHSNSIYLSWLPLFHDMGLGNALQACFIGIPFIFMSPTTFLKKPIRWLKAISTYHATITGGPGFAYDLCVRHIKTEQLANLDLSCLEVAANGAEPVNAETIDAFSQRFAPYGFQRQAFYPCYGMAESTLFITGGNKQQQPVLQKFKTDPLERHLAIKADRLDPKGRTLVGCGRSYLNTKILIVNPTSRTPHSPGEIGEIWVSSNSVALGYWHRPQATQETFQAHLSDTGEGPFLRTGDLGCFIDGELFVTGRMKDVMIIRGQNHYPQDIEQTVQTSHPSLRPDCGVAFSTTIKMEERLIIVQEVYRRHLQQLNIQTVTEDIREAVVAQHGLQVYQTLLVRAGSIPKTSSGKLQRQACKQAFLNKTLNLLSEIAVK